MAINASTLWEVRGDGHDDNGGGFVSGTGTDRSQQASPHVTLDGTTVKVTSSGVTNVMTLTGHTGVTADVGNIVKITGGTNATLGHYQITSAASGSWTVDANWCSGAVTDGAGRMGGGKLTLQAALTPMAGGNVIWIKGGYTYTLTSALTMANTGHYIFGYNSTRGDYPTEAQRPIIAAGANSIGYLLPWTGGNNRHTVANLTLDGTGYTGNHGIGQGGGSCWAADCRCHHFSGGNGFATGGPVANCESDNNSVGFYDATYCWGCWAHDNTSHGFSRYIQELFHCLSTKNGGDGFNWNSSGHRFWGCIADGNTGHGFVSGGAGSLYGFIGCLATNHTGVGKYGFKGTNGSGVVFPMVNCAVYNNTNHVEGTAYYYNVPYNYVTLTASPYNNAATNDYRINNTAGGGADLDAGAFNGTGELFVALVGGLPSVPGGTGGGGIFGRIIG